MKKIIIKKVESALADCADVSFYGLGMCKMWAVLLPSGKEV